MNLRRIGSRGLIAVLVVVVASGAAGAVALARSSAVPSNTSPPTISGTAREGETLTAHNGTWTNSPTSFAYQWRRCTTDGITCGDIAGATKATYDVTSADVSHTLRVVVSASNADGKGTSTSDPTDVVDSKNGPTNSVRPAVSGTARVGEELTVSNGTWSPTPTSFSRLWQRCDSAGENCRNITGATGRTYGVRSADIDHRLRALVTAHTSSGVSTVASSTSGVVTGNTTTTTSTTTVQGNHAPTVRFISLKWVGRRLSARFRVCDDDSGKIGITIRHNKARALPYTLRTSVIRGFAGCGSYARSWVPPSRFRTHGKLVLQLRASDSSRALSRIAARSIFHR